MKGSVWLVIFVLVPLLLICVSKTNGDTSSSSSFPAIMKSVLAGYPAADDLAAKINNLLKEELEKEFGPLKDHILSDEDKIYGRVIAIDYQLPEGKRLDDTWGDKAVMALGRLGITAEYDGNEVRAEQQTIAGKEASSIQFTTQRTLEDPDVIGFVAMFPRNN
jgi:hypothetical protein